jgi:hypothetical protein
MSRPEELAVTQALRQRARHDDVSHMSITLRLSGGAPGESRIFQELHISGDQPDTGQRGGSGRVFNSVQLRPDTTVELFRSVSEVVDELIPRSEAHFLPDSLIGAIEITVDGQSTTVFYDADPDSDARKSWSPKMNGVVERIEQLLQGPENRSDRWS